MDKEYYRRRFIAGLATGIAVGFIMLPVFLFVSWAVGEATVTYSVSNDLAQYKNADGNMYWSYLDEEPPCFLPDLKTLPSYENIEYEHRWGSSITAVVDSIYLIITYDEETYRAQKELLWKPDSETHMVGSFEFHVRQGDDWMESSEFLGCSDTQRKIAYLYFEGMTDDKPPLLPEKFIKKYFRYRFK
jgi:hypothetical protein